MRTPRTVAVVVAGLVSGLFASPAFADEPSKPAAGGAPSDSTHDTAATAPDEEPEVVHKPTSKERRRNARIFLGVGGGLLGAGWAMSVAHAVIGREATQVCREDYLGFTTCEQSRPFRFVFIPVAGPLLEAVAHDGPLTTADTSAFVMETVLQLGGVAIMGYGIAIRPSAPRRTAAEPPVFTLSVAPEITSRSASLGVVGTF